MLIKRRKEKAKALPIKDVEQAFTVGNSSWFTNEGAQYEPTGMIKSKRSNYYINKIARLESELKKKEDIINISKRLSSELKNKVIQQDEELDVIQDVNYKVVVNEMVRKIIDQYSK